MAKNPRFNIFVGIIVAIVNGVVAFIAASLGIVSPLISGILTAFITPIIPIALTLYYYSMKARTLPPPPSIAGTNLLKTGFWIFYEEDFNPKNDNLFLHFFD